MNEYKADIYIREWKELEAEKNKFKEIAETEKKYIDSKLEFKLKRIKEQQQDIEMTLQEFSSHREDLKETKTQFKYTSLSGEVVMKKDMLKIKQNLDIEDVKKSDFKHFITVEQKEKLNWADMKRLLVIKDKNIINTETGEIVNLKGLELEEEKGKVIIK